MEFLSIYDVICFFYRFHNTMRVYQKLSDDHIFLSRVSKMWNHLAEEVLNDDMYNLMTKYQESVKDGTHLEATLDLLDHTKEIVKVFRSQTDS